MKLTLQNTFIVLVCALLLITSACQPTPATTSPLSAGLTELSGTVNLKDSPDADFIQAAAGMSLIVNGQVKTGEDGRVRLDLSSGTIIRLVPSTLFTLESNEPAGDGLATKLKLEIGKIFIILNGGSLDVETPSGVASVLGSYMMVEVDPLTKDALVTCLEGNCSATNPAGTVKFTDGQKTVLFHAGPDGKYEAPELLNMSEGDFQTWLDENPEAKEIYNQYIAKNIKPTATKVPPTATSKPASLTPASTACFKVIYPLDKTALPHSGPVTFLWEEQPGAMEYLVTFYYPDGTNVPFQTTITELTRYMDTMLDGGDYLWDVAAIGNDGNEICRASGQSFNKPSSKPDDLVAPKPPEEIACTVGQWDYPDKPCYCDPGDDYPPSYCYGGNGNGGS